MILVTVKRVVISLPKKLTIPQMRVCFVFGVSGVKPCDGDGASSCSIPALIAASPACPLDRSPRRADPTRLSALPLARPDAGLDGCLAGSAWSEGLPHQLTNQMRCWYKSCRVVSSSWYKI